MKLSIKVTSRGMDITHLCTIDHQTKNIHVPPDAKDIEITVDGVTTKQQQPILRSSASGQLLNPLSVAVAQALGQTNK